MQESHQHFAPVLYVNDVAAASLFYQTVFEATALRRWANDDGSVHVAELQIGNALFHLHEEAPQHKELSPQTVGSTSVVIGLFVPDPHDVQRRAITAGAIELNAVQDYDYGYRQGSFADPFGHHWAVQKTI